MEKNLNTTLDKNSNVEEANLNLMNVFSIGFGGAVGSGIFVLLGEGIAKTGRSIVLAVIVAVLFMLIANFFSIILSSMFVLKGGDYSQKALAFNPLLTGVSGYANFSFGFSIAMYAVAIVEYASIVFPQIIPYGKLISIGIITLFFLASTKGSKFISVLNSIMTTILLGSLFLFIIFGIPKVETSTFINNNLFTNGFGGFIAAVSIMSFACQGITQGPVSVAAVTKKSSRTIPFGILLTALALGIVYALIAYVSSGVLPISEVAGQNLSLVADRVFPQWIFVIFILGGAVFSIATSLLSMITMVRYPILKIAEDGWLPQIFTKTNSNGYPYIIYSLFYIVSILPILLDFSLDVIVSLIMIPLMLMNVYLNLSCIKIIKEHPDRWKNSVIYMPTPIINTICILAAVFSAIVAYNLFIILSIKEMFMMIGLLVFFFGYAYYNLKTKRVSKKQLEASKEAIINDSLN